MNNTKSSEFFKKAAQIIPGGVNSPVRACKSVGIDPLFIDKAVGCFIYDADGNRYIDYVGSWGPMILGHRHSSIIKAVSGVLERGTSFGAPTDLEIELAQRIIDCVESVEMVRMVNSGTEATMSAVRLARGYTERDIIIKFDGCYHGHGDALLVEAGSGVATLGIPGSPGIPKDFAKHTISIPYNDIPTLEKVMQENGENIACIIVEPVAGNMGLVKPAEGFLQALRDLTEKYGAVLIFDEVMTGFRVALGGAQQIYGIKPDLTTFGKVIGGGLPVGAYGGRREIMECIAPQGSVYQAGTLSGNPAAMAAGIAALKEISQPGFYDALDEKSEKLLSGLKDAAHHSGIEVTADRAGSMLGMFFTDKPVDSFEDAKKSNTQLFAKYYRAMLKKGVYLAPSQFEVLFVSSAHNSGYIEQTISAAKDAFKEIR